MRIGGIFSPLLYQLSYPANSVAFGPTVGARVLAPARLARGAMPRCSHHGRNLTNAFAARKRRMGGFAVFSI